MLLIVQEIYCFV